MSSTLLEVEPSKPKILIVSQSVTSVAELEASLDGWAATAGASGSAAATLLLGGEFDAVIFDLGSAEILSLMRGMQRLKTPPVLVAICPPELRNEALHSGAMATLDPCTLRDETERLKRLISLPLEANSQQDFRLGGHSTAMSVLRAQIRAFAKLEPFPVLVVGEPSTARQQVAEAIHRHGASRGPISIINCPARDGRARACALIAKDDRYARGKPIADAPPSRARETVVLRGVETLPPLTALSLLNATRSSAELETLPRIIGIADSRRFRDDWLTSIDGESPPLLAIRTPPLRERLVDIPQLARGLLRRAQEQRNIRVTDLSEEAISALQEATWPFNLSELRFVVELAARLTKGSLITRDCVLVARRISDRRRRPVDRADELHGGVSATTLREIERQVITMAFLRSGKNVSSAAEQLGIPRSTLRDRLKRYGIR